MAPLSRTGSAGSIEGVSRALSAVTDRDTYRRLAYLSTALLLGTLWFAGLVTGFRGRSPSPSRPWCSWWWSGSACSSSLQCGRCSTVRAPRRPGLPGHAARRAGRRPRAGAARAVPRSAFWKAQAYLALRFLLGLPLAVVQVLSLFGSALFLITGPIHYRWIPQADGAHGFDFGIWHAESLGGALLLVPAGLVLLVLAAS